MICLFAVLLTFIITFTIMTGARRRAEAELAQDYKDNLDSLEQKYLEKYASINEMYSALPDDQKSSELFMKLAYVDIYYRSLYVGSIDEDRLSYYLMRGYIDGIGDKYGEYYTADDLRAFIQQSQGTAYGIGVTVV